MINKKNKKLTLAGRRALFGLAFISPWLLGFIFFYVRSLIMAIQFSLSEVSVDPVSGGYVLDWVGIKNFTYEFTAHATFKQIFASSMREMLINVPLVTFFSLFMAILLNKKFRGRTLVRAILFLPVILNSEAISEAISLAQQSMLGGLNATSAAIAETLNSSTANAAMYTDIFENFGLPRAVTEYIISMANGVNQIISLSGVQIVIFIAALQSIPSSLYEVAKIEGATAYETFWKVTLPMVTPHIITNVVYTVVDAFVSSDIAELAYTTAFKEQTYGLSNAMSLTMTFVVCSVLFLICYILNKFTFYYN
ncbi:MAG: sugar ABC transporter permease [Lachnospiraceae bacterium]|nr:sugar ABC transporter permease [Lachnospiraceae bacterium]